MKIRNLCIFLVLALSLIILGAYVGELSLTRAWASSIGSTASFIQCASGLSEDMSRRLAFLFVTGVFLLPWTVLRTLLGMRARLGAFLVASAFLCTLGSMYLNYKANFGLDGKPKKFVITTDQGTSVTTKDEIDPETGVKPEPLTQEIYRQLLLVRSRLGRSPQDQPPRVGNFNSLTGKPERWFIPDTCEERELPGFDPESGHHLIPATTELVDQCKKARSDNERRRVQLEESNRKKEHGLAISNLIEEGRYISFGEHPVHEISRVTLRLLEIDVLKTETWVQVEIESAPERSEAVRIEPHLSLHFELLNSDGSLSKDTQAQLTEGLAEISGLDSVVTSPPPGQKAIVVVKTARESALRGRFSIVVNSVPVFQPSRYRWTYRQL